MLFVFLHDGYSNEMRRRLSLDVMNPRISNNTERLNQSDMFRLRDKTFIKVIKGTTPSFSVYTFGTIT